MSVTIYPTQPGTFRRFPRRVVSRPCDACARGYCQPGFIMATTALLAKTPNPTDADIDAAITNLCRCGTYPAMRAAIKFCGRMRRNLWLEWSASFVPNK